MKKSYKLNPDYIYSSQDDKINIINVEDSDENIYTLSGVCAEIFPIVAEGKDLSEAIGLIKNKDKSPDDKEIDEFLENFAKDLIKMNILQEK